MSDFRSTIDRVKLLIKTAVDGGALDESAVIRQIGADITPEMAPAIVDYALRNMAWACIRDRQRAIEARHTRERIAEENKKREEAQKRTQAKARKANRPVEAEYAKIYDDPGIVYGSEDAPLYSYFNNQKARNSFKSWCKKSNRDFGAWVKAANLSAGDGIRDTCGSDWHPQGVAAYFREKDRELFLEVATLTLDWAVKQTELRITQELLGSEFALGDGRRVTWGEATVEDHEDRVEMLKKNIAGNAETAARHIRAIEMIKNNNVNRLADLEAVAV